ncbi:hypothetical protein DERP_012944 [Dermatophagoides pteronyssinus]|uniref:Uncharacterized protein n=1 Tax=Dermatophagoides pteronyssinus TaxID=6956 RepID=A0ABQ8J3V3_DERPT|nr:hypothetical protein DERP_012944 [Dermatophagoides pteronyssinus]
MKKKLGIYFDPIRFRILDIVNDDDNDDNPFFLFEVENCQFCHQQIFFCGARKKAGLTGITGLNDVSIDQLIQ